MSVIRALCVAVVLAGGLGCSGLGQKLLDLTGSEIHVGKDAVRPADFPLPEPAGGTLLTSATMNIGGMHNTSLQYEVPSATGVLDVYEQAMRDAGHSPNRQNQMGTETVTAVAADGEAWTAAMSDQLGKATLTLSVVRKGKQ